MKKVILVVVALLSIFTASGQVVDKALGIRFGGWNGYGAEISYQHPLSSMTRIEADLSFNSHKDYDGFGLAALHHWVFPIESNFQWYAGVGGTVSFYDYNSNGYSESGMALGLAGDIGIEYCFKEVPLQLAIDFRPSIGLINSDYVDHGNLALAIRYRF